MKPVRVKSAVMANAVWKEGIEDYSLIVLQSGPGTCIVETGYIYPATRAIYDMRFSIRTDRHYFLATGPETLEVSDEHASRKILDIPTTNSRYYPDFVSDVTTRAREGRPPVADMGDMTEVMQLAEQAYTLAGRPRKS
jgi:predicted dehydrogenase